MPAGGRRPGAGAPKGNMNALKSGRYSPRFNAVRAALSQVPEVQAYLDALRRQQLRTKRMTEGALHAALLEVLQGAPSRNNPLLAHLRKTPPGPPGPARDPDRSQSKEDHPTASARALPRETIAVSPPGRLQKTTKKRRTILQRESIKWHFC